LNNLVVEKLLHRFCLLVLLAFVCVTELVAQASFQQRYETARAFFKDGKYNLAMEAFKPLIPYDQANPYQEYASYYYALSAYRQGYKAVAKDMFTQIKTVHPTWEQIDEVNLWLARIHFENRDHFQGLRVLEGIKNQKLKKEVERMKRAAVDSLQDAEVLRMMGESYPEDEIIGRRLAGAIANSREPEDVKLFESLVSRFRLDRSDYVEVIPKTIHKDVYNVSVLFPFVVNSLEATNTRKPNQFVLDLYEGISMAVDTLNKMGVRINLRVYDTERNPEKLKAILAKDELKSSDLIIGPVFAQENTPAQEFSQQHKINLFNLLSNSSETVASNPYGFLFQPSLETLGKRSAEYVLRDASNKNIMVFYGDSKRDSTLAAAFLQRIQEDSAIQVKLAHRVLKDASRKILEILQTPTAYDEFKYPSQFTLPKDSVDVIYVASDDPLIFAKVISSVETRRDNIQIVGSENWLEQTSISYAKYQTLNIALAAPGFSSRTNPWYQAFTQSFIRSHGRTPGYGAYSNYAKLGYEFMLFAGHALKKYGVYFQEGLAREKQVPGYLTSGFDYSTGRDNAYVPFIKSVDGELVVIDK
jgi:hypothetical protein